VAATEMVVKKRKPQRAPFLAFWDACRFSIDAGVERNIVAAVKLKFAAADARRNLGPLTREQEKAVEGWIRAKYAK
jgi:hypothetical protein